MIDAHVHVWDLARRDQPWIDPEGMEVIHRDHAVSELEAELGDAGVDGAVLVQVLNDADETDDYLGVAAGSAAVLGVVGWVDLMAAGVADELDRLSAVPGAPLLGIRHQALAEPDPAGWMLRLAEDATGLRALTHRGLVLDLMLRPEHLDAARRACAQHGDASFVLDHAGKPPVADGWGSAAASDWARAVSALAELPTVCCKVSGLTTMADLRGWTVAQLRPWFDHLLDCFDADRLLFGSDWPVSRRAGEYDVTVGAVRELVETLSASEQEDVLGGTAQRVYGLPTR